MHNNCPVLCAQAQTDVLMKLIKDEAFKAEDLPDCASTMRKMATASTHRLLPWKKHELWKAGDPQWLSNQANLYVRDTWKCAVWAVTRPELQPHVSFEVAEKYVTGPQGEITRSRQFINHATVDLQQRINSNSHAINSDTYPINADTRLALCFTAINIDGMPSSY